MSPELINAIRREYAKLPRNPDGRCRSGSLRGLVTQFGVTRAQIKRALKPPVCKSTHIKPSESE